MEIDRTIRQLLWRLTAPSVGLTAPILTGLETAHLEPALQRAVEEVAASSGQGRLEAQQALRRELLRSPPPVDVFVRTEDAAVLAALSAVAEPHRVTAVADAAQPGDRALLLADLDSPSSSAVAALAAKCPLGAIALRSTRAADAGLEEDWANGVLTKPLDEGIAALVSACGIAPPRSLDPQTGLLERRGLRTRLDMLRRAADRTDEPLSLALIRLEELESVRKLRGALDRDTMVDLFAAVASDTLRGADLLGRWSDDEFLLVLPGTSPSGTVRALENMQERLYRTSLGSLPPLTFGAGITAVRSHPTFSEALRAADAALFESKSTGNLPVPRDHDTDEIRRDAVAVLSHELRTPLTVIEGALGLIESGKIEGVTEQVRKLAQMGRANTDRLLDIVTDLIDLQGLREDQLELYADDVVLTDLVASACAAAAAQAREAEVALVQQVEPGLFRGDTRRLHRVLVHLLRNAIEHSPPGGQVRVRCRLRDDVCRFRVEDQGPGVDLERVNALFAPFRQRDLSATRRKGGVGLGLAVCKGIVGKHGGQIGVQNLPSGGASFWLEVHPLPPNEQ